MVCATCNQKCGKGTANVASPRNRDQIYVSLCRILCKVRKEFCEGKHKGKKQSSVAEKRAKTDPGLKKAIKNHPDPRIRGGQSQINRQRYVRLDNAPKSWKRAKVAQKTIQNHLNNIERQIKRRGARILATKAGKAAARSWLKLVPVLNVISTAYDVYDIGSAGVDIYKQVQKARESFSGDVYRTRPDVAINGPNGQLQSIYDFKFDGDRWQDGQQELYTEDLKNSGAQQEEPDRVDAQRCGCDGPPNIRSAGAIG